MNSTLRRLVLTFISLTAVLPGLAWNKPGHMTVAAVAYQDLKRTGDDQVIQKTITLLKSHPYYANNWLVKVNSQQGVGTANHDQFVFMYAGRWADDARGSSYDHETCHYINLPYKPAGQPASVPTPAPPSENLTNSIASNIAKVRQTSASRKSRAIALAWLFHLYGDVHQPLHTATLFTTDYPNGDRGGTRFYIRRSNNSDDTLSLHKFWDDIITTSERFATVKNEATRLINLPNCQRNRFSQLSNLKPNLWALNECLPLAKTSGYKNGDLLGGTDDDNGEPLPNDYHDDAKGVAEAQIMLAGYRLADFLRAQFH